MVAIVAQEKPNKQLRLETKRRLNLLLRLDDSRVDSFAEEKGGCQHETGAQSADLPARRSDE